MTLQLRNIIRYGTKIPKTSVLSRSFSVQRCQFSQSEEKLQWSYKHGGHSAPLSGLTLGKQLEKITALHPDRDAHVFCQQNVRLTFEQLLEKSDELAAGLVALGLQKGDRVAIWAPNVPEWVITQYAAARAGFILVNINPAYQTSEVEYALNKVGVKAIITSESFKTQDYYGMLSEICPELNSDAPGDLNSKRLPDLKLVVTASERHFPGALRLQDVVDAGTNPHRSYILDIQDKLQFDDPINIQFTSGTTGKPKGATLTHHNILNNAIYCGARLDFDTRDTRICVPVPLYHCFGMVCGNMQSLCFGNTIVYPSPSFQPEPCLQAVQSEKCTALYGTPTMFIDVLALPNLDQYDTTSLNTGIMAGSPCPVEVMKQCVTKLNMPDVTIAYGTTENSPITFQGFMDDPIEVKTSTIGQPTPHVEAKVIDGEGNLVPVGVPGELCTRGYMVMRDYWDDEEKTKEVIGSDRWYRTGDQAEMDENGYVKIVGRIKDLIIRGGENIYPVEVENYLYKHPKISDVQVIGIPDDRLGEQVCAVVILRPGVTATEQEIQDFCKGQIAHFKIPKYIRFVDEYPLTVVGKIQKYKLRQDFSDLSKQE